MELDNLVEILKATYDKIAFGRYSGILHIQNKKINQRKLGYWRFISKHKKPKDPINQLLDLITKRDDPISMWPEESGSITEITAYQEKPFEKFSMITNPTVYNWEYPTKEDLKNAPSLIAEILMRIERHEELCKDTELKDYVRMASHAYGVRQDSFISSYWTILEKKHDKETDLKAVVYKKNETNKYVISFAGTQSFTDGIEDILQVVGLSRQYEQAYEYARKTIGKYQIEDIAFTGHSQGGGEAAYCAYLLGGKAVTFNPAVVSSFTKSFSNKRIPSNAKIDAYIYTSDVLNIIQEASSFIEITSIFRLKPDGNIHYLGLLPSKLSHMHGMDGFLKYFGIEY